MAKFDVHPLRNGRGLVVDCQSDLLDRIATRFVVPLMPADQAPAVMARLNPICEVEGERYVFFPQLAGSIPTAALDRAIASLADDDLTIGKALDVLISGV
ncbi:MAG: CcdB family protein [Novosphingobium sp.]